MKAYLIVTGIIFTLFALSHVVITWEHWRSPEADFWSVVAPVVVAVLTGLLAAWAFRLMGRARGAAA